jgi:hypothetical protein
VASGIGVWRSVNHQDGEPAPAATIPTPFTTPFTERRATYATGDKIHYGQQIITVGANKVVSFVQTDVGFVYADKAGDVFIADGHRIDKVGSGNRTFRLKSSDTGSLVGWVDRSKSVPEFVVYDAAARREVARTSEGNKPGKVTPEWEPTVIGIDGGFAYLAASDGLRKWDLSAGSGRLVKPGLRPDGVEDVAAGRLAFEHQLSKGHDGGTDLAVSPDINAIQPPHFTGWHGDLSPGARYLLTDISDKQHLFRLSPPAEITLRHPDHPLIVITQWVNDNEFFAIGFRDKELKPQMQPIDLLHCSVTARACSVVIAKVAPYPADDKNPLIQLPRGRTLDDW